MNEVISFVKTWTTPEERFEIGARFNIGKRQVQKYMAAQVKNPEWKIIEKLHEKAKERFNNLKVYEGI